MEELTEYRDTLIDAQRNAEKQIEIDNQVLEVYERFDKNFNEFLKHREVYIAKYGEVI